MPLTPLSPDTRGPRGPGVLYVVALPIGDPEDITLRALSVLQKADAVVCEDTRLTARLLARYKIGKPLESCHEHNEEKKTPRLVARLLEGASLALVTDAGTPLVSDPGFRLVSEAAKAGVRVAAVPGPCAAVAALCVSGLATDSFFFTGFLPRKKGKREQKLAQMAALPSTLVFYESPRRVAGLVSEILSAWGDRRAVLCRELTKPHEEVLRDTLSGLSERLESREPVRGECTLVVAGAEEQGPPNGPDWLEALELALAQQDEPLPRIAARVAGQYGLAKKTVYEKALEMKKGPKPPS